MKLFRDLSIEDLSHHLEIARDLIPGNIYRFRPAIQAVPLERLIKGVPNENVPISFSYGEFLRWRSEKSVFQDCLFLVQTSVRREAKFEFIVPLLFTRDMPTPRLV